VADPEEGLARLLDVDQPLVAGVGHEPLESILHHARTLTRARYAALEVLDEDRRGLQQFLTVGAEGASYRVISHGEMRSFLGVPIVLDEQARGNLYLAEKQGGEHFTVADLQTAAALAQWAAIAIGSARGDGTTEPGSGQLEGSGPSFQTTADIDAVGGVGDFEGRLDFIVKRGRDIVGSHSLMIMLRDGDELLVAACAGLAQAARGRRLAIAGSLPGQVLERGQPHRVTDVATELEIDPAPFGLAGARAALLVPMLRGGTGIGLFAAFDHGEPGGEFTGEDVGLLRALAQATANAVAAAASVRARG
jgi:GAF domain-containing protein